ncbi:hypothetical protein SMD20_40165 [Nonomuraea sp. LP-02]|uniref:hypothetical protein n=1 Tax=Nonomuraea sp. LP-02 TaxID=3097960 RepID=UPI002E2F71F1|nr:hypothetical protein [Nonomuraea sp. LP-02]MED7930497.1 hypothetical protein [Nonomuraea sp. LP-02]
MRIIARCAIAVAAASALAIVATPAVAATGQLGLRGPGGSLVVQNPKAGCINTAFAISQVANHTNAPVTVHTEPGCAGAGLVVAPGSTVSVGTRHSVRVLS